MKKFAGNKTLDVIKAQCKQLGLHLDQRHHKNGGNHIIITSIKGDHESGRVFFNTFNGNFFGTTPDGVRFNSMKTTHKKEPWFQALLSFFYVEKVEAAS